MTKQVLNSELLRSAREELGLTQAEAAALLKTSERNYRRWEAGAVNGPEGFRLRTAAQRNLVHLICAELGIAESELLIEVESTEPTQQSSPLHRVPLPSRSFVGRTSELARLCSELTAPRACACVEGLPGMGKTELALQVAHALAAQGAFPGGVFWFSARDGDLTGQWASDSVAGRLGLQRSTMAESATAVVTKLSQAGSPLLLILDDVTSWSREEAPGPLPEGTHVATLVTTRKRRLGGSRFLHLELESLEREEAQALLVELSGQHDDRLDDLLDHLGGYALAVEIAGVFLREHPSADRAALQESLAVREEKTSAARETSYEASLGDAFAALWATVDPSTREAWVRAASFESEPFSDALADSCRLDADARRRLQEHHLLSRRADSANAMHQLTRDFAYERADEDERARAERDFVDGCSKLLQGRDYLGNTQSYALDATHHDAAWQRAAASGLTASEQAVLTCSIGYALEATGELRLARTRYEEAIELSLRDEPNELETDESGEVKTAAGYRNHLARTCRRLGDHETAIQQLELALEEGLARHGDDHVTTAMARANLGLVLWERSDYERARSLMESAAEVYRNEEGPDEARVVANLALVVYELGDLARAGQLARQVIESAADSEDVGVTELAIRRANYALVLRAQGDLAGARDQHEQALAALIDDLGEDHVQLSLVKTSLAVVLLDLGELDRARQLLNEALSSDLEVFGADHVNVARDRGNLAMVLAELGERDEARRMLEQVLASVTRQFGEASQKVARWQVVLAEVLASTGQLDAAEELARRALATDRDLFADTHRHVCRDLALLSHVLGRKGELEEALEHVNRVLDGMRAAPVEHPQVAEALAQRAWLRSTSGRGDAEQDAVRALEAVSSLPTASPIRRRVESRTTFVLRAKRRPGSA
ncbi:MAG: tetratricopeptide repeat protein [Acidobacteriota bacterium]